MSPLWNVLQGETERKKWATRGVCMNADHMPDEHMYFLVETEKKYGVTCVLTFLSDQTPQMKTALASRSFKRR